MRTEALGELCDVRDLRNLVGAVVLLEVLRRLAGRQTLGRFPEAAVTAPAKVGNTAATAKPSDAEARTHSAGARIEPVWPVPGRSWVGRLLSVAALVLVLSTVAALGLWLAGWRGNPLLTPANIITVGAFALFALGASAYGEGFLAGLWLTSPLAPGVASVATVISYLVLPRSGGAPLARFEAIYIGGAVALLFIACSGFIGRGLARRDVAQMRMYGRLRDRFSQLADRYAKLSEKPSPSDPERADQVSTALLEADSRLRDARSALCQSEYGAPALRWALATGYSDIQRNLHRVEEMIIAAQPRPAAVGDAVHDLMSLHESTIAQRQDHEVRLVSAMRVIAPKSAATFFSPLAGPAVVALSDPPTEAEARDALREVRFAINEFRDERVDGLIRVRNRTVWALMAVGLFAHLLLGLAILMQVPKEAIAGASVIYLVGAVVGLLSRLHAESGRGSAVEDYGLYMARLVAIPLRSGLAGVAGVFLVAKMPEFLGGLSADSGVVAATTSMSLGSMYNIAQNELALLVAAVFGLVPAQLMTALQRQAERYQLELEKSEPSGGSTLPATGGDR